jgi:hypothetical protein
MGVGRNLAYRKSLFLDKKGFNQFLNITGGDDDLFVNQHATGKNTRIQFAAETHVLSVPESTWKSFFHQKVRHLSVGKHYRLKHRIQLGIFTASWIVTWFAGIALMIISIGDWWIPLILAAKVTILTLVMHTIVRQTQRTFELWTLPFLDFLYTIYYISTGLATVLTKKIRWRN